MTDYPIQHRLLAFTRLLSSLALSTHYRPSVTPSFDWDRIALHRIAILATRFVGDVAATALYKHPYRPTLVWAVQSGTAWPGDDPNYSRFIGLSHDFAPDGWFQKWLCQWPSTVQHCAQVYLILCRLLFKRVSDGERAEARLFSLWRSHELILGHYDSQRRLLANGGPLATWIAAIASLSTEHLQRSFNENLTLIMLHSSFSVEATPFCLWNLGNIVPRNTPHLLVQKGVLAFEFSARTIDNWRHMFLYILRNLDREMEELRALGNNSTGTEKFSTQLVQQLLRVDGSLNGLHHLGVSQSAPISVFFSIPYVKECFRTIMAAPQTRQMGHDAFKHYVQTGDVLDHPFDSIDRSPQSRSSQSQLGPHLEDLLRMNADEPLLVFRNWAGAVTAWTMAWSSIPKSSLAHTDLGVLILQIPVLDAYRIAPMRPVVERSVEKHFGQYLAGTDRRELFEFFEKVVGEFLWEGNHTNGHAHVHATAHDDDDDDRILDGPNARIHFEVILSAILARAEALIIQRHPNSMLRNSTGRFRLSYAPDQVCLSRKCCQFCEKLFELNNQVHLVIDTPITINGFKESAVSPWAVPMDMEGIPMQVLIMMENWLSDQLSRVITGLVVDEDESDDSDMVSSETEDPSSGGIHSEMDE